MGKIKDFIQTGLKNAGEKLYSLFGSLKTGSGGTANPSPRPLPSVRYRDEVGVASGETGSGETSVSGATGVNAGSSGTGSTGVTGAPLMTYEEWFNQTKGLSEQAKASAEKYAQDARNNTYSYLEAERLEAERAADEERDRAMIDANASLERNRATYGQQAEAMAKMGLTGSGYSDYINSQAYAASRQEASAAKAQWNMTYREAAEMEREGRLAADGEYNKAMYDASAKYFGDQQTMIDKGLSYSEQYKKDQASAFDTIYEMVAKGTSLDDAKEYAAAHGITLSAEMETALTAAETAYNDSVKRTNATYVSSNIHNGKYSTQEALENDMKNVYNIPENSAQWETLINDFKDYQKENGGKVGNLVLDGGLGDSTGDHITVGSGNYVPTDLKTELEHLNENHVIKQLANLRGRLPSDSENQAYDTLVTNIAKAYVTQKYINIPTIDNIEATIKGTDDESQNAKNNLIIAVSEIYSERFNQLYTAADDKEKIDLLLTLTEDYNTNRKLNEDAYNTLTQKYISTIQDITKAFKSNDNDNDSTEDRLKYGIAISKLPNIDGNEETLNGLNRGLSSTNLTYSTKFLGGGIRGDDVCITLSDGSEYNLKCGDKIADEECIKYLNELAGGELSKSRADNVFGRIISGFDGNMNSKNQPNNIVVAFGQIYIYTQVGWVSMRNNANNGNNDAQNFVNKILGATSKKTNSSEKNSASAEYAGWDAGKWQSYFANIRQTKGASAAETELNRMSSEGIIPTNMITYAAIGARGKFGH